MTCHSCGKPLTPRTAYQRIIGWERPMVTGRGSSIVLREKLPEFACQTCISALQAGVQVTQETLL